MPLLTRENRQQLRLANRVGAVGLELVLATALGWFGGRWADGELAEMGFATGPWLAYTGFALGVIAGFRGLAYLVKRNHPDRPVRSEEAT